MCLHCWSASQLAKHVKWRQANMAEGVYGVMRLQSVRPHCLFVCLSLCLSPQQRCSSVAWRAWAFNNKPHSDPLHYSISILPNHSETHTMWHAANIRSKATLQKMGHTVALLCMQKLIWMQTHTHTVSNNDAMFLMLMHTSLFTQSLLIHSRFK